MGADADMQPGASKSVVLILTRGSYILLCKLPGHYAGGMFTTFVVE